MVQSMNFLCLGFGLGFFCPNVHGNISPLQWFSHKVSRSISFQTKVVFAQKTDPLLQITILYLEFGNGKQ